MTQSQSWFRHYKNLLCARCERAAQQFIQTDAASVRGLIQVLGHRNNVIEDARV